MILDISYFFLLSMIISISVIIHFFVNFFKNIRKFLRKRSIYFINLKFIKMESKLDQKENLSEEKTKDTEISENPENPENPEKKDDRKRFQWIKGENAGDVEIFKGVENKKNKEWMLFESGRRINFEFISEYMIEVAPGQELLLDNESLKENNSFVNEEKVSNPIRELLKMQKSTDTIPMDIQLKVSVPTSDLFNVLYESFGEEFEKILIEDVVNSLDVKFLSEQIKEQVKKEFEERFKQIKKESKEKPKENE